MLERRLHIGCIVAPNSFNVIYANADVEHYYFDGEQKEFVLKEENAE